MQEKNQEADSIKTPQFVKLPTVEATKKKAINKLKDYQKITALADEIVLNLPKMQEFVDNRLLAIKQNKSFGCNIEDGGIGDWLAANEAIKSATSGKISLEALNARAKKVLSTLVKQSQELGILPSDKAYFAGEKICYFADKEFAEIVKLLTLLAEKERWLKRRGFVDSTTDKSGLKRN